MSIEHQINILKEQMNEILEGLSDLKNNKGDSLTIKQLEKTRKSLEAKLEKLNDQSRKDVVITFEQLGVDKLFNELTFKQCRNNVFVDIRR